MQNAIKTIPLPMPLRIGSVNCYLVNSEASFSLIDTGVSYNRKQLVKVLESGGCKPGNLQLIILTHGDFDHAGNAAYLRSVFGGKIAMHADDVGMAEQADMFVNRHQPNKLIRKLMPLISGFGKSNRFTPDILVKDGDDLSQYGLEAKVISIPGHSKGSIGVLTADAALFCGDLLVNTDKPALGSIIDDPAAAQESLQKLVSMDIGTVYPGHGKPFIMKELNETNS